MRSLAFSKPGLLVIVLFVIIGAAIIGGPLLPTTPSQIATFEEFSQPRPVELRSGVEALCYIEVDGQRVCFPKGTAFMACARAGNVFFGCRRSKSGTFWEPDWSRGYNLGQINFIKAGIRPLP